MWNSLVYIYEVLVGILIINALNLNLNVVRIDMFIIASLPILKHILSFHLFSIFKFVSSTYRDFQHLSAMRDFRCTPKYFCFE